MAAKETCERCGAETPAEYMMAHGAQRVCEDCAMSLMSPAKACDPWAVKMAKGSFATKGDAVASLTGTEKRLYELITEKGRVPVEKLPELLGVPKPEIDRATATLRHMELLRGDKRPDGGVDSVPFECTERALS